jgi:hypothetical protein
MTATNHMLAGAVVAVALHQPILVLPVAFMSHFVLDAIPHFGIKEDHPAERNRHPLFRYIIVIDIAMAVCLMVLLPAILKGVVSRWVLMLGMFFAFAPDLVWIRGFISEMRTKTDFKRYGWFANMHQRIQWFEKPWGLVTEVVWFGAMATLLGFLAA